ncbi:MAG: hypothetical protein M3N97_10400 [Pseudomonadota bacterium]|nr:hypothetical protein [Pseudomonadota bacterium]
MQQRTVTGPFRVRNLGAGVWQLSTGAPSGAIDGPSGAQRVAAADIYLRGAGAEAAAALQAAGIASIGIEWCPEAVKVMLSGADTTRYLSVASAIIHEPQRRLYESLPLASFDTPAKRFWTRVFRLMRIPGGRFLLRFIARRKRAPAGMAKP